MITFSNGGTFKTATLVQSYANLIDKKMTLWCLHETSPYKRNALERERDRVMDKLYDFR